MNAGDGMESYKKRRTTKTQPKRKKLECQFGCKSDNDCKSGLICASDRQDELVELGLDQFSAYCQEAFEGKFACYDSGKVSRALCRYYNVSGICDSSMPSKCYEAPVCCRQYKRTRPDGKNVCFPRECKDLNTCACGVTDYGKKWRCKLARPNCRTDCVN